MWWFNVSIKLRVETRTKKQKVTKSVSPQKKCDSDEPCSAKGYTHVGMKALAKFFCSKPNEMLF